MKEHLCRATTVIMLIALIVTTSLAQSRDKVIFPINPHRIYDSQSTSILAARAPQAPTAGSTAALSSPLTYHGGPLINTPTVYFVWYGNWNQTNKSDTPAGQQLFRNWASGIGGTPHFALNKTLSVANMPISGNVLFGGETTSSGTRTSLSDAQILSVINSAITNGKLPYDPSGVYFLIASSNVTASSGFCTQYCGWHNTAQISRGTLRYSFIGNANRCLSSCAAQTVSPNNNPGVDASISVITHELEEATTDPDITGWTNSAGSENGDLCAWTFGQSLLQLSNGSFYNMTFGGNNWLIQRNVQKTSAGQFCMVDSTHN